MNELNSGPFFVERPYKMDIRMSGTWCEYLFINLGEGERKKETKNDEECKINAREGFFGIF